jgi:hypothetical protein
MNDRPRKWTSFGQMMQNQFSQIKKVQPNSSPDSLLMWNLEAVLVHNNNKLGESMSSMLHHLSSGYKNGRQSD